MTNSEKLRALADWLDQYDANAKNDFDKISNEVQRDLRAMAAEFEQQHSVSGSLQLHSNKELLDRYTKFLQKNGYIDTDATCEEPFAIDEFLRNDR